MPSNVEIKARVADLAVIRERALALGAVPTGSFDQEDVFFRSRAAWPNHAPRPPGLKIPPTKRLKLRIFAPDRGELISYERPDSTGPKVSDYHIARTSKPAVTRAQLTEMFGELATVRKWRELLLIGQTRIHLDQVEGLGDFVELEVALWPGQSAEDGAAIAEVLLAGLGIAREQLMAEAYVDLLLAKPPC